MKISEVILKLEKFKFSNGDVDVLVCGTDIDDYGYYDYWPAVGFIEDQ